MVNKYIKALLLTIILLILGLSLISYLDQMRFDAISNSIEETSIDIQATQQLILYETIFGDNQNICKFLEDRIGVQIEDTQKALRELKQAESQNFLGNSDLLKARFLNQNIGLYLLVEKAIRDCGYESVTPVLYFYTENAFVAEEASQSKVLDYLTQECANLRVFAMPHDLDIPVVEALKAKHSVNTYPSVIVGDKKFENLVSGEELKKELNC